MSLSANVVASQNREATDPLWIDVGFALQGTSAAIGYGITSINGGSSLLSSQVVGAGATTR
jgi:hypothetical protein